MMVSMRSQSNPAHCQFLYSSLVEWFFKVWKYYILNGWEKKQCFMTHKKYMRFRFQVHKQFYQNTATFIHFYLSMEFYHMQQLSAVVFPFDSISVAQEFVEIFFFFYARPRLNFFQTERTVLSHYYGTSYGFENQLVLWT